MSLIVLESALRALALAFAAWAALSLFGIRNVFAQKYAWTVVLAASFAMPLLLLISAQWPAWPGATLQIPEILPSNAAELSRPNGGIDAMPVRATVQTQSGAFTPDSPSPIVTAPLERFPAPSISSYHSSAVAPQQEPVRLSFLDLAGILYITVAALLLMRLIGGLASVLMLWRSAEQVSLDAALMPPGLNVRTSPEVSSPVSLLTGVVLPANYASWDEKKLRIVLAHEQSHIRQGDFYLQLLAELYQALVWFSPLGWLLKRKLSDLGEAISDRAALDQAHSRFGYAKVLLEFAAAPRTPFFGVAMARPSSLTRRMERLLNESAFSQAFAGGSRVLVAALLAPVVLFAASALVRVEAAPIQAQSPVTGQSHPDTAPILDSADAQSKPQSQSQPTPQPDAAPAAAHAEGASSGEGSSTAQGNSSSDSITNTNSSDGRHYSYANSGRYSYSYADDSHQDSYALVLNNDSNITFSGDWNDGLHEEIERLRKSISGSFLWFRHEGKDYIVTDPAIVQRLAQMYAPIEKLGKEQEELGRQQEALGKKQEALGKSQESAAVTEPDTKEQMAKLKAELAELDKQIDEQVTQATVNELQARLSEVQERLGAIQGELGAKQGELGRQQGELGEQQGRLGEEQGRLGEQQGKLARDIDSQVKSIIDQTLKNGTAQPAK